MKILITGVAGFIGYHLALRCLEEKYEVIGIDNLNNYYDVNLKEKRIEDLSQKSLILNSKFNFYINNIEHYEKIEKIYKKFQPNCVIHLAAQAGVRYSLENPLAYINTNLLGFGNIIDLSKKYKVDNFLYASSSSVYGGNENMPYKESSQVGHPVSLYAATKRSNELIAHTYSNLYSLPCTGIRFFTVYGPWGRPDMAYFLFTKAIINNEPIKVFNKGEMLRDFTYIDDVIEILYRLINKPAVAEKNFNKKEPDPSVSWAPHKVFNVGNSNPQPLIEYISAIEEALKMSSKKVLLPMQLGDVKATYSDNTSLKKWINFQPETSIKYGIKKFVDWYIEFYKSDL